MVAQLAADTSSQYLSTLETEVILVHARVIETVTAKSFHITGCERKCKEE